MSGMHLGSDSSSEAEGDGELKLGSDGSESPGESPRETHIGAALGSDSDSEIPRGSLQPARKRARSTASGRAHRCDGLAEHDPGPPAATLGSDSDSDSDEGASALSLGTDSDSDGGASGDQRAVQRQGRSDPPRASGLIDCFGWVRESIQALRAQLSPEHVYQKLVRRAWIVSTHFSGLGTVDVALSMIRNAADPIIGRGCRCTLEVASSCEKSVALQKILVQRSPESCVYGDIFEQVAVPRSGTSNEEYRQVARNALGASAAACRTHRACCRIKVCECNKNRLTINVSGTSCRPWSSSNRGARRRSKHPDMKLFYAWAAVLRRDKPAIAVHENVRGFEDWLIQEELGDLYEVVCCLHASPAHAGFSFVRRPRVYHVLRLRSSKVSLVGLPALYDRLADALRKDTSSWHSWVWQASDAELQTELEIARRRRGSPGAGWVDLLTEPQRSALIKFEARWLKHHGRPASSSPECMFDLGDSAEYKQGLPRTSSLPTIRRRASIWWSPSRGRWMTPREKAACMGFPVYDDLARAALVDRDDLTAEQLPAIGNAMHVASVGLVLLATMCAAEVTN